MASVDCEIRFGIASVASPVAWAGGGGRRNAVDWLPRQNEPFGIIRGDKVFLTEQAHRFLRELGERVGGVQGPSIPQIQQTATAIQAQVAENTNYAVKVADYATQVAQAAEATRQVAQNSGLTGSGSIPSTGSPPSRPNYQAQ